MPRVSRYEIGPGYAMDFVHTDDGKPVGSVKNLANIHGDPYYNVTFAPLEFIGIDGQERAIGLIVKLYETTLEYLRETSPDQW